MRHRSTSDAANFFIRRYVALAVAISRKYVAMFLCKVSNCIMN